MNQHQQFETEQALRDQRVTPEEMRAVVDLWSRERGGREGVDALPSVSDVAEGLEVSPAEAVRLLEQVRARQARAQEHVDREAARERLDVSTRLAEAEARKAEAEARRAEAQAPPRGQAEQIRQLQELRASGVLSEEEFARAKERVLGGREATGGEVALLRGELQRLQIQNELEALDREWLVERERYATHGKGGTRYPEGSAVAGTVAMALVGLCVAVGSIGMMISEGAPPIFLLILVAAVGLLVAEVKNTFSKSDGYRQAHAEYQRRREELQARLREPTP